MEGLEAAELRVDGFGEGALRAVVLLRRHELAEVEVVVQDLSRIVQHATLGGAYDFLQTLPLKRGAGDGGVEVVDVPLQVLAIMKTDGLAADDGLQCFRSVW